MQENIWNFYYKSKVIKNLHLPISDNAGSYNALNRASAISTDK